MVVVLGAEDAFSINGWRDNDYTRTALDFAGSVPIKNNCPCSLKQQSSSVCF